jgi:hypothetical protein
MLKLQIIYGFWLFVDIVEQNHTVIYVFARATKKLAT